MLRPPSHQHGSCSPTSHSDRWALSISGWGQSCTLNGHGIEKNRELALSSQGAAQKDDIKEPRLFPLLRCREALNSLTWAPWFSLIYSNLLMVWLPGFCCKIHVHSDSCLPFSEQFLWTEMLSPRFALCVVSLEFDSIVTSWTVAHQAPLSMGFSRQEYWSGKPFPPPGDLPDLGIELQSPAQQVNSLLSEPPGKLCNF